MCNLGFLIFCLAVSSENDQGSCIGIGIGGGGIGIGGGGVGGLRMTFNPMFNPGSCDQSMESVTSLISTSTGNSISPQGTMGLPPAGVGAVTAAAGVVAPPSYLGLGSQASLTGTGNGQRPHSITSECSS